MRMIKETRWNILNTTEPGSKNLTRRQAIAFYQWPPGKAERQSVRINRVTQTGQTPTALLEGV